MFRFIASLVSSVVLLGLGLALVWHFDWDITAVIAWAWESLIGLIEWIAKFFTNAPWFQEAVR